jgi:hypothetical protein
MSEWIPVSERLPPEETRVLAYDGTSVFESEYMHGRWEWLADVTHWLPMPNPPKQQTLTDAERQAIEATIFDLEGAANYNEQRSWPMLLKQLREQAATLRGLLARTQ